MEARTAFTSLDGEAFIVPQSGALDIQTEFGKLLVRQNEFAVIPRGVKYRVGLPDTKRATARGYVIELHDGHFRLPELGIIGSTGLANQRDFQIPTACYDGKLEPEKTTDTTGGNAPVAVPNSDAFNGDWTIISRHCSELWSYSQPATPFDVAAWHGTLYPYKYDLAKFSHLENAVYDHHDPSLFTVMTAPAFGKQPGTAVVDVTMISPRWVSGEYTLDIPWNHRNTEYDD
jgi:homogentisate 1,2-dioxygenase